jgi:hypothetical protein
MIHISLAAVLVEDWPVTQAVRYSQNPVYTAHMVIADSFIILGHMSLPAKWFCSLGTFDLETLCQAVSSDDEGAASPSRCTHGYL